MPLISVNSYLADTSPTVSTDGLAIIFASRRPTSMGFDLWVAIRSSTLASFGTPELVANVNSSADDYHPFITVDGEELWLASLRAPSQGVDIWRAPRTSTGFGPPIRVTELSSSVTDYSPVLSADRLTIFFASDAMTSGTTEIFIAHRNGVNDAFLPPTLISSVNSAIDDIPLWLSPDNCRLYLSRGGPASLDIMVATRHP